MPPQLHPRRSVWGVATICAAASTCRTAVEAEASVCPSEGAALLPTAPRAGGRSCGGSGASAPILLIVDPRCPSGTLQSTAHTGVTCPPQCPQTHIPIARHCSQPCLVASSCPALCLCLPVCSGPGLVLPCLPPAAEAPPAFLVWAELPSPVPRILACVPLSQPPAPVSTSSPNNRQLTSS